MGVEEMGRGDGGRSALPARAQALHAAISAAEPGLCAERALLVTRYFKTAKKKPTVIQKAEALAYVLSHKTVRIHPDELLVGCFTSHRVGGGLYPELHGVAMLEDLFRFDRRAVNPLAVRKEDRRRLLLEVLPYWLPRSLIARSFSARQAIRAIKDQLSPTFYLINELAGISHFVPNYAGLLEHGTDGFRAQAKAQGAKVADDSPEAELLRAVETACNGLDAFAEGYCKAGSGQIAEVCAHVPRRPARSFHEALQSILFAQIALNLESLDNAVSPGRLDQVLWPYYERDLKEGRLTKEDAFELLACFALKLCEIVPIFSKRVTRFHGGLFNGQVVVIGGLDQKEQDATNELSFMFLELMDRLRTRQPNYHARLHRQSPAPFRARIASALAGGAASPAVYNDDVIVPLLESRGIKREDALDYATIGCVEPSPVGKGFLSTDAALFNLPLCLELALNGGRRFGHKRRCGAHTPPGDRCRSTDEVVELFKAQVEHAVKRLLGDLVSIERANARVHPTPLTSTFVEGCIESARDASAGGAIYNGSGIQGVGAVEVGDSLAAIEAVVFRQRAVSLPELIDTCRTGFIGQEVLRTRLVNAPKYGNDDPMADGYVARVMEIFAQALRGKRNTRGGDYVAGFYSVTAHLAFGEIVGALPSGRRTKEPFSSGLSPSNGLDRRGPTAALCSQASLPLHLAHNGINFNLTIGSAPEPVKPELIEGLIGGGFEAGCMQIQTNVFDPQMLIEARDHPGRYPGLLVRVSGYSAYFDDLSLDMKEEVIHRALRETAPRGETSSPYP